MIDAAEPKAGCARAEELALHQIADQDHLPPAQDVGDDEGADHGHKGQIVPATTPGIENGTVTRQKVRKALAAEIGGCSVEVRLDLPARCRWAKS